MLPARSLLKIPIKDPYLKKIHLEITHLLVMLCAVTVARKHNTTMPITFQFSIFSDFWYITTKYHGYIEVEF
jgi:hypothetical protein